MRVLVSPWHFCPVPGPVWRISPAKARSAADQSGLCSWSFGLSWSPSCFSLPPAPVLHVSACPDRSQMRANVSRSWVATVETFRFLHDSDEASGTDDSSGSYLKHIYESAVTIGVTDVSEWFPTSESLYLLYLFDMIYFRTVKRPHLGQLLHKD